MNTIGTQLKAMRKSGKLSQAKVAEKVGVSQQTIGQWEAGETTPRREQLERLRELFPLLADYSFPAPVNSTLLGETLYFDRGRSLPTIVSARVCNDWISGLCASPQSARLFVMPDSAMEPTIQRGATLVVDIARKGIGVGGDIYLLDLDGQPLVRRAVRPLQSQDRVRLSTDARNDLYDEVNKAWAEARLVGRVVAAINATPLF